MDGPIGPGRVRFKVHGHPSFGARDIVVASVFAEKMQVLVRALKAADRAVNDRVQFDYVIADLAPGSAMVEIAEQPKRRRRFSSSGIVAFDTCVVAVNDGNYARARNYGRCAHIISKLAKGAEQDFGYGELWVNGHTVIRVDSLLMDQGKAAAAEPEVAAFQAAERSWFKGHAHGSFVGRLLEVDFRGALPQGKLVLSAGGKELDCIFRAEDIDRIRASLNERVRVEGRARYDGKSGFPRRLEVTRFHGTRRDVDFSKWKGALIPFEHDGWDIQ